jgi:ABC-type transport system involved in multi-copper enzyme maturation permease subunit
MTWLLWKDYRHNRLIVITGLVLLLLPYVFAFWMLLNSEASRHPGGWAFVIAVAGLYSLGLGQLTIALIGGNAIAGERVDRSAEFLASLPLTRKKILASKLLLALAIAAVIWANALLTWCLMKMSPDVERLIYDERFALVVANIATTGLVFFCVAWFFSSFLSSPTFAIAGALVTPLLVASGIVAVVYLLELPLNDTNFEHWYYGVSLTVALVCFGVGTLYYLRRVEP